jgi:hypothetical protein
MREEFYAVTNNIRHGADKMPESEYGFKPAAGIDAPKDVRAKY